MTAILQISCISFWKKTISQVHLARLLPLSGHCPLFDIVMHSFTTARLPSDLQLWSPEHLIPFDTVCHSGCNCHLLKAFKTIKSFSVLGAWQYISALIRTLGCWRNCPPRANPAPRGAVPTKLIILCSHTSWNTATASGKYRFGVKHYNVIPITDLPPPYSHWRIWHKMCFFFSLFII